MFKCKAIYISTGLSTPTSKSLLCFKAALDVAGLFCICLSQICLGTFVHIMQLLSSKHVQTFERKCVLQLLAWPIWPRPSSTSPIAMAACGRSEYSGGVI